MSNRLRLREATDRDTWDDVVSSFGEGLMFHDWDWLDLQEAMQGHVEDRLLVDWEDRVVGIFRRQSEAAHVHVTPDAVPVPGATGP